MKKYRKKPVVVEAIQWDGTPETWLALKLAGVCGVPGNEPYPRYHLRINTLEGIMRVDFGDWIIKGVAGEFYPCKPEIFAQTYEELGV